MLAFLKKEALSTRTENGAAAYASTMSDCVDLFSTVGALRAAPEAEIADRFIRAWAENPDLAMKIAFFARDVRGGLGERRAFRVILKTLTTLAPASVVRNLANIPEYGRCDDLMALLDTPCRGEMLAYIRDQLAKDVSALRVDGETVSLLAKWLPSVNASSADTVRAARRVARALGMSDAQYRKSLSALRARIAILENNLRERDYTFDYARQPSKAMFKYRKAFLRNDGQRYQAFLEQVRSGEARLNTGTLYPYELVSPILKGEVTEAELPATLYFISDMEFDSCAENADLTNFEYARRAFAARGYALPRVVFWNVASRALQQSVTMNEQGVALVSGCTPRLFEMVLGGRLSPYAYMLEVLSAPRYRDIAA